MPQSRATVDAHRGRVVIEDFHQEHNAERPHSPLDYDSPRRFAARNTLTNQHRNQDLTQRLQPPSRVEQLRRLFRCIPPAILSGAVLPRRYCVPAESTISESVTFLCLGCPTALWCSVEDSRGNDPVRRIRYPAAIFVTILGARPYSAAMLAR